MSGARIFTIGHSNHDSDHFRGLLAEHEIEVLVDVRSWPHSRFVEWADAAVLPGLIAEAEVKYLFLGKELGGRPERDDFYDADGHVLYGKVARQDWFMRAVERLERGAEKYRVAIMCSEEDPTHCHRRLLVSKVLLDRGATVAHIRKSGRVEIESGPLKLSEGTLFEDEESLWRSSLSVSRGPRQRTSSGA
ncbi:MAG TPA: DUF488 domain-containing protein [Solirubrobacterales bacterium]|nr:DUF488 domain-containing protein [Solirubrobacterales bacterium]